MMHARADIQQRAVEPLAELADRLRVLQIVADDGRIVVMESIGRDLRREMQALAQDLGHLQEKRLVLKPPADRAEIDGIEVFGAQSVEHFLVRALAGEHPPRGGVLWFRVVRDAQLARAGVGEHHAVLADVQRIDGEIRRARGNRTRVRASARRAERSHAWTKAWRCALQRDRPGGNLREQIDAAAAAGRVGHHQRAGVGERRAGNLRSPGSRPRGRRRCGTFSASGLNDWRSSNGDSLATSSVRRVSL